MKKFKTLATNKQNKSAQAKVQEFTKRINEQQKNLETNNKALLNIDNEKKDNYREINSSLNAGIINDTLFTSTVQKLGIRAISDTADDKRSTTKNLINTALVLSQKVEELFYDITAFKLQLANEDFLDETYQAHRNEFLTSILTLKSKYGDLTTKIAEADINDTKLNFTISKIQNVLEQVKTIYSGLVNIQMAYYTLPIDVNGKNIDLLKMTVERRDKVTNALLSKNDYQIWIKGGIKIDISAGVFITSLKDDKYFTVDDAASTATTPLKDIYKSNQGKYGLGFGSMLNLSYRTGSAWVKPGFSVGAMISESQKFQGLAGLSLMLGKEERAVLHWGLSFGSITQLENSYQTFDKGNKPYSLGASSQVPTAQRFAFGHFFGFTYNITGTKVKTPSVVPASGQ